VLPLTVGTVGADPTTTAKEPEFAPQLPLTVTLTFPDTAVLLHVVVMLLVP
jgi:hypothetical protein